jgi:hypothetical protein
VIFVLKSALVPVLVFALKFALKFVLILVQVFDVKTVLMIALKGVLNWWVEPLLVL